MKIFITQPCPTCAGDKIQLHPLWAQLFTRQEREQDLTAVEFFTEHYILDEAERPQLVIPCQKCQGTGEVAVWVPVHRLLELVQQARQGLYKVLGGAPL